MSTTKRIIFFLIFTFPFAILLGQGLQPTDYEALVNFRITDDKGIPEQDAIVVVENTVDKTMKKDTSNIDGNTEMLLKKGTSYKLKVEKFGGLFDFGLFEVPKQDGRFTMEENLQIKVITKYNRVYELKIHFAPNKSDLYQAAKTEIDKLYDEMVKNPTMKIEVAGHTDNVGLDQVNLQVSQRRANSIKEYLVQKGISENRIVSKGYGETAPIADNSTEEGRTRNRRIEIRML